jgi:aminopeptidase-like protein
VGVDELLREKATLGDQMYQLIEALYPICRSITGNGVRQTLSLIEQHIPVTVHEVPTGTQVFDWTVPKEWNISEAFIKDAQGNKIVDFEKSNLHVLNYSVPIEARLSLQELKPHLFTLPDHPDWIPYRTSYYKETWGFCLSHKLYEQLEDGEYEVRIDSSLVDGHLTYGEYFIPGQTDEEVLFSCHVCHPSLCNDNLSGIALMAFIAKYLSRQKLRYSYRFLFIPGTIGSITWLHINEANVYKIKHGIVVQCVGDGGRFSYKKSRKGNAEIDRAVINVLQHTEQEYNVIEFYPYGYDERQYCSPGFNLAVGSLSRTTHGRYPEYHTSADNLDLVRPEYLTASLSKYLAVVNVLENNVKYLNQNPKGEPQLGKRGLYTSVGAQDKQPVDQMALLWVLNLSDGEHSLLDISERSGLDFHSIKVAAHALLESGLLKPVRGINR